MAGKSASEALQGAYESLMAIQDPEELKTRALDVLSPHAGTGRFTLENYKKFGYNLEGKISLFDVQKYITDFMLVGFGLGARTGPPEPRGKPLREPMPWQFGATESIEMVRVDDDIEAIASFLSEDPDEKLYDNLTDQQKSIKEMVEAAGFKIALREQQGVCVKCGSTMMGPYDFDDEESRIESEVNRLCQKCQDEYFDVSLPSDQPQI